MFSREGGSPAWAPAFAGEQGGVASEMNTAPTPNTTPAKAGAQLGDSDDGRYAQLFQPFQLGPGLRRGGDLVRPRWLPNR
jgi:hypothetical protein